ncbi:MAG: hypothetical protein KAG10_04215 [Methylococcales bacterium]|nr:hypothetical protein [Methylococcales bacterium]
MPKTTLAFHNFNKKQSENFSAILTLSAISLNDKWNVVAIEVASAIFVGSEQGLTQNAWDEIQSKYIDAILVAYSDNLAPLKSKYELLTKITKLPARAELIVLLNQLAIELEQKALSATTESLETELIMDQSLENKEMADDLTETIRVESRFFLPNDYFLGVLLESIELRRIYDCKSPCGAHLYLCPQQKKYVFSAKRTDLKELLLMSADDFTITELSQMDFEQNTKSMESKKLNDLLWLATIVGSQGRLMKGHGLDDVIHLKHWPDISHIKTANHYLIIAAFMSRNTVDMETIVDHTEQTLEDVIDFHNGCHVLGLIERDDEFSLNSQPVSDKLRQLRGRIFESLHLNVAGE